jgi:hypothetical protein
MEQRMGPLKLIVTTIREAAARHKAEFRPRTLSPSRCVMPNSRESRPALLTGQSWQARQARQAEKIMILRLGNLVRFSFIKFSYNRDVLRPAQPWI